MKFSKEEIHSCFPAFEKMYHKSCLVNFVLRAEGNCSSGLKSIEVKETS